jgi:DAACS family dicarboxylate/amino acid:cation (Na+ or H+) symporter
MDRPERTPLMITQDTRPQRQSTLSLPVQMLIGLVAGLALAQFWPTLAASLQPIGTAFIDAVKMIVIPLVVSAVSLGAYRMGADIKQLGRVALISFAWFYFATLLAIIIAIGLDLIFHPGFGLNLTPTGSIPAHLASSIDWVKFALDLIPSNIVQSMAEQKTLPTLVFAVLFGLSLAGIGSAAKPVVDLLEGVMAAMFRLTGWIVALSPLAVFGLVAYLFATQGFHTIAGLGKLVAIEYVGLALMVGIFLIMMGLMGEKPFVVTRQVMNPVLLAFTTRSSEVTLPVHMQKLEEMGMPNRIVSVVLPLGYAFNIDGTTLYVTLATTFLAEAYNVTLGWSGYASVLITTLIASKGVANVPSGGLVILATVLTTVGLPIESIALIAGIDAFLDMGRTAVNVFGNTVAAKLVMRFAGASVRDDVLAGAGAGVQPIPVMTHDDVWPNARSSPNSGAD